MNLPDVLQVCYMRNAAIALFGEAEKGEFRTPYVCRSLPELAECFGQPPAHSQGLFFCCSGTTVPL